MSFSKKFFHKDGQWSKTACFLSIYTFILFFLWLSQSLFVGTNFWGWIIPEFNTGAAIGVGSVLATTYLVNHKTGRKPSPKELKDTAKNVREVRDAVIGD